MDYGIAVWDVIRCCQREGSLDVKINKDSMQVNNFNGFFERYPSIKHVFFNGGVAENLYCRYVRPNLDESFQVLLYQRLPSTSPAHASLSLAEKIKAWQVIKDVVSTMPSPKNEYQSVNGLMNTPELIGLKNRLID